MNDEELHLETIKFIKNEDQREQNFRRAMKHTEECTGQGGKLDDNSLCENSDYKW